MNTTKWTLSLFALMVAFMMVVPTMAPLADDGTTNYSTAVTLGGESSEILGNGTGNGVSISYRYITGSGAGSNGYALLVDLSNPPQGQFLSYDVHDSSDNLVYKSPTESTPAYAKVLFKTIELVAGTYLINIFSNGGYSVSANLNVTASLDKYTITITQSVGGTVNSPGIVNEGEDAYITVTPDSGYSIGKVTLDGEAFNPSATHGDSILYVIENVRADHSVDVTFIPIGVKYAVNAVAGTGGKISPTDVELAKGETATFTITPNDGYTLNDVRVNGISVNPSDITRNDDGTFTYKYTHNVEGTQSIVASFKQYDPDKTYIINASAGANGKITPSGEVSIKSGESISFKITPNSGYKIDNVLVDGKTVSLTGDTYKFLSVTENHTISVTFKKDGGSPGPGPGPSSSYTINATAGTGGSISPQGSVSVSSGSSKTFKFTPNNGYEIDTLLVDGKIVQIIGDSYTFSNVTSNHTISVTFKKTGESTSYTISASAGSGGKITPSGKVLVEAGKSQTFTISANKGYEIDHVTVNGKEVTINDGTYTFSNVNADQSISVTFKEIGTEPMPSEGDDGNNTMYYILIAIVIIIILVAAIYLFMRNKH